MTKGRLEAFSDGVIAIIITIMVLELKTPRGADFAALRELLPTFLSYILSFIYVGIYWNNHHHMLQAAEKVNGPILWANLHLLFWLSLTPFTTAWMGEHYSQVVPVALYGTNLLLSGVAYYVLARQLVNHHDRDSKLSKAIGADFKGLLSIALYAFAIFVAFINPLIAKGIYVLVAIIWFVPDTRIERALSGKD